MIKNTMVDPGEWQIGDPDGFVPYRKRVTFWFTVAAVAVAEFFLVFAVMS